MPIEKHVNLKVKDFFMMGKKGDNNETY